MKIVSNAMAIGLILFCLSFQAISTSPFDFSGIVTGYSGDNMLYVNITESSMPGLKGETEVLLSEAAPRYILQFIVNKKLDFDYLGRDISGRLISDAYFGGVSLQELDTGGPTN
jgi:hypothetical protein